MKKILINSSITEIVIWLVFCLCLAVFSLGISWKISTSINLNYGMWYDTLKINLVIDQYAVQNKFDKKSFAHTEKSQHVVLFSEILSSVTHKGIGLNDISYKDMNNEYVALLTNSEVTHLQDVSRLIDKLTIIWGGSFILLCFFYVYFRNVTFPNIRSKLLFGTGIILCILCLFSWYGFTSIFYYLHTVVFPENHQWFFYYQDSLMSTLMKAPDLFEVIGIMLSVIALFVYYLVSLFFRSINIIPK